MPIICLGILDVIIIYFSIAGGLALSYAPESVLFSFFADGYALQKIVFVSITFTSLFVIGAYTRAFLTDMKMGLVAIVVGHFISLAVLSITFYVYQDVRIWIRALAPGLSLSLIGIFVTHLIFDRVIGTQIFKRNLLIVGAGPLARKVAAVADHSPYLTCIGFVPLGDARVTVPDSQVLRDARPLVELARHHKVGEIVVAVEERRNQLETKQLLACRLSGIQVSEPSSFIERHEGRVEVDGLYPSWMIFGPGFISVSTGQRIAKRLFDFVTSSLLLAFFLPLMVLTALLIWASGGGPVLYRQDRVGLNGRAFTIWKFRSMRPEAESDGVARWSSSSDARVTLLGRLMRRFRMDELPQLWNVLKGEMSFIGPRPERPEFVRQLAAQIPYYDYRHIVKPGISGWAQINFPYGASFKDAKEKLNYDLYYIKNYAKEKLNYDLYYIKNYSLALDFLVLLQTARVIIWPTKSTRVAPAPLAEPQRPRER
jgi:sugar transferase (PEP-CTERM system associated)